MWHSYLVNRYISMSNSIEQVRIRLLRAETRVMGRKFLIRHTRQKWLKKTVRVRKSRPPIWQHQVRRRNEQEPYNLNLMRIPRLSPSFKCPNRFLRINSRNTKMIRFLSEIGILTHSHRIKISMRLKGTFRNAILWENQITNLSKARSPNFSRPNNLLSLSFKN